jgi:hypothetical protein
MRRFLAFQEGNALVQGDRTREGYTMAVKQLEMFIKTICD